MFFRGKKSVELQLGLIQLMDDGAACSVDNYNN